MTHSYLLDDACGRVCALQSERESVRQRKGERARESESESNGESERERESEVQQQEREKCNRNSKSERESKRRARAGARTRARARRLQLNCSFMYALFHVCDTTFTYVWHGSRMCGMPCSYVWHDWFISATRLIHICVIQMRIIQTLIKTYEVATISRPFKIIGLFCKRALWKRLYSAKGIYNFKEPTNRSQPIFRCVIRLIHMCDNMYVYMYTCMYT